MYVCKTMQNWKTLVLLGSTAADEYKILIIDRV